MVALAFGTGTIGLAALILGWLRLGSIIRFIPYPVINADLSRKAWFTEPDALRLMLAEYAKMAAASMRAVIGYSQSDGLRSEQQIETESTKPRR